MKARNRSIGLCLAFLPALWAAPIVQAGTSTWTGAGGNNRWENPNNWNPPGVPGENDDVVIPANPPNQVLVNDTAKCVKSLTNGGAIRGDGAMCLSVSIKADVISNTGLIAGGAGTYPAHPDGGNVTLSGGSISNTGLILGGNAFSGLYANMGKGGSVTVSGDFITNTGTIQAGNGATADTGGSVAFPCPGGPGGSVEVTGGSVDQRGRVSGGFGGRGHGGPPDGADGEDGDTHVFSYDLHLFDFSFNSGEDVRFQTKPGGGVFMPDRAGELTAQAKRAVHIDAGPGQPIDLTGNMPGFDVIEAGSEICLHGMVLLEPGVTLDMITTPDAAESPFPCDPGCSDDRFWREGFEGFFAGDGLHGRNGWRGWDNDPGADAIVTDAQHHVAFKSVEISAAADLVHTHCGATGGRGRWSLTLWQYIPSTFSSNGAGQFAGTYVVLMNTFAHGAAHDPSHFSGQIQFDSNDGMVKAFHGDGSNTIEVPYQADRWVKIKTIIDLDEDWTRIYYDDALVTSYPWTGGVLGDGGGARDLAAVDLYANGSSPVYYDDVRLEHLNPRPLVKGPAGVRRDPLP